MRQASILHRASSRDMNQFSFRHSCRSLPLKDSPVALSVGVPGREKSILMPLSYTHLSSIFLQIQSRYRFSTTAVTDALALCCSAFLPLLLNADSAPHRSPGIRECTVDNRQQAQSVPFKTAHQRHNP